MKEPKQCEQTLDFSQTLPSPILSVAGSFVAGLETSSPLHQSLPVCARRKLAGFADKSTFVAPTQTQTRDGFSFDIISQSDLTEAPLFNVSENVRTRTNQVSGTGTSNIASSGRNERGTEIGTRYRYIDDTPLVPFNEAGNTGASTSAAGATAKTRSRPSNEYVLYAYGEPVAVSADGNTNYFGTDILGSVRNITDKYGAVEANYNYDAFGAPYLSNLDHDIGFGYCGKTYDTGTGLYDYGFRDYSPNQARFTTVDPVRDGSNWFSYVVNDPVNYIDPLGLESTDNSITIKKGDTLSDRTWQYNKQHGTNHTWQEIAEYNGLENPHLIFPGDVITFPTTPTPPAPAQPTPSAPTPAAPAPTAPAPTVPTPSVPSAPPVSTGNLSSPSGGGTQPAAQSNAAAVLNNFPVYEMSAYDGPELNPQWMRDIDDAVTKFFARNFFGIGPEGFARTMDGRIIAMSESGYQFAYSERIADLSFFCISSFASVVKLARATSIASAAVNAINTVDDVLANPSLLQGKSLAEVQKALQGTTGWVDDVMRQSARAEGWVFREMNQAGTDFTGRMIQYHPGTPRHFGGVPYWKVSTGTGGTVRIPVGGN